VQILLAPWVKIDVGSPSEPYGEPPRVRRQIRSAAENFRRAALPPEDVTPLGVEATKGSGIQIERPARRLAVLFGAKDGT
jgi:hypothetical protein